MDSALKSYRVSVKASNSFYDACIDIWSRTGDIAGIQRRALQKIQEWKNDAHCAIPSNTVWVVEKVAEPQPVYASFDTSGVSYD